MNRPRPLRAPPPREGRRRAIRWIAATGRPFGRVIRALGWADQRLLIILRTRWHTRVGDRLLQLLGGFGEFGAGWASIGIAGALARPAKREPFLRAALAAPIAALANYAVKLTIGRQRPLIEEHPPLARAPSKLSFPSAHATSSVAGAVAIGRVEPGTRRILYPLAGLICVGRSRLGMHYPSDVLAGVILGTLLGRIYPLPTGAGEEDPA